LLSGYLQPHAELARLLTAWKTAAALPDPPVTDSPIEARNGPLDPPAPDTCRTVLFSSGYAANLAALSVLPEHDAQIFSDRKNHASLVDGLRMSSERNPQRSVRHYRHRDFGQLQRLLAAADPGRPIWIVTDSIFSMDGTCTRPTDLAELVQQFDARVLVDEAHATGVVGPTGGGWYSFRSRPASAAESAGVPADKLVVVGTLSKALGSAGGFIVAPSARIDQLVQAARTLIYSTSLPVPAVAAANAAVRIAATDDARRVQLTRHINTLHQQLQDQGWQTCGDRQAPLLAVVAGDVAQSQRLAGALQERGIWAPAIRPPTVKPLECRVRLSPTATMTDEDLQQVVNAFADLPRAWRSTAR
jgi:8-amino-7-oxononanoate synthase